MNQLDKAHLAIDIIGLTTTPDCGVIADEESRKLRTTAIDFLHEVYHPRATAQ